MKRTALAAAAVLALAAAVLSLPSPAGLPGQRLTLYRELVCWNGPGARWMNLATRFEALDRPSLWSTYPAADQE